MQICNVNLTACPPHLEKVDYTGIGSQDRVTRFSLPNERIRRPRIEILNVCHNRRREGHASTLAMSERRPDTRKDPVLVFDLD